ncbi:hypothetical protein [Streptomyces sp. NBC_00503]|uniref:hypothetical protein n=1 Tax=Streptomyces sp. NBC_00503 TaxID=2903659 RepID=UPI002E811468|nr:hypothetical protein [Streptomyces sp. NBC_00503]WUD84903.1 hypothetical protein OG490_32530 [Streptomyces sp. NBC_00503]
MSARRTACCVTPLVVGVIGLLAVFAAVRFSGDFGKAWAITYTAKTSGSGTYGVTYQDTEGRYPWEDTDVRRHSEGDTAGDWRKEVVIVDGKNAKVTIIPAKGAVATCAILLDGRKVLARGTSPAAGQPAVCESAIKD